MTTVSGVVVNYRTPDLSVRAVRSLVDDGVDDVVLVDNGSGHENPATLAKAFADDARVTVVASPDNVGFGRGVNLGAGSARGDALFLLNSDAVVVQGSTGSLVAALDSRPGAAAVAPRVEHDDGSLQADAYGLFPSARAFLLRTNRRSPETDEPDWVSGAALLIRRQDFELLGGFDPIFFMYFEDVDLCRRLRAQGRLIVRDDAASVRHSGGISRVSDAARSAQYRRSLELYLERAGYGRLSRAAIVASVSAVHAVRRRRAPAA